MTYPLAVVSTISSVSGSALIATQPPRMKKHSSWIEIFKDLHENVIIIIVYFKFKFSNQYLFQYIKKNQLNRGSSSFFRVQHTAISSGPYGFVLNQSRLPLTNDNSIKKRS